MVKLGKQQTSFAHFRLPGEKFLARGEAMPDIFAGVEGGRQQTVAVVVDDKGRELGRNTSGASSLGTTDIDTALGRIREALNGALMAAGAGAEDRPAKLVLGLAGRTVEFARWQEEIAHSPELAPQVETLSDIEILLCALPQKQGLAVIADNGALTSGRDPAGKFYHSGGWDFFFGGEGGAVWIGREALNAISRAADGRGSPTILQELILQEWGLAGPSEISTAIYNGTTLDATKIAGLAKLVFSAAEEGDDLAGILLKNAVNELAMGLKACDAHLMFDKPPALAIAGRLLLNHPTFLKALTRRLDAMMTIGTVVRVEDPALIAAQAAANL